MKQVITDPNGSDRRSYFAMGGFVCSLSLMLPFTNPALPEVGLFALFGGILIIGIGVFCRPYVVLDPKGVTHRLLFRKKFYRWGEVVQVGIRNTKATKVPLEYKFPVVIILPGEGRWKQYRFVQDIFYSALIPSRQEIRKFVDLYYGPLDFNDFNGLNNWQKQHYDFQKK